MEAFTGITTPEDILRERHQDRVTGHLHHIPNENGELEANSDCACCSCRDILDPTGEKTPPAHPFPSSPPKLVRQNALCYECGAGHSSKELCFSTINATHLHLPPPPPLSIRLPPLSASSSNVISPIAALMTPRSVSESVPIEQAIQGEEASILRRLLHMLKTYDKLESHIHREEEKSKTLDERTMAQMCWEDMQRKREAVEQLIRALRH